MKILNIFILSLISINIFAEGISSKLMSIAMQEAQIANIGANKATMLYTTNNGLAIINRWIQVENKPKLTKFQVEEIQELELQKQKLIKQAKND